MRLPVMPRVLYRQVPLLALVAALSACASLSHTHDSATADADRALAAADAAIAANRLDVALSELERATRRDPARLDAWLRLATLRSDTGQHAAAAHAATLALQVAPDSADARALLSHASLRLATATLDPAARDGALPLARLDLDRLVVALRGAVGDDALVPPAIAAELAALRARDAKGAQPPPCPPARRPDPATSADPLRVLGNGE